MTKFVTVASYKGGVGKTTTAVCLCGLFSDRGLKVLLIDSDLNRSASLWAGPGHLPFQVATEKTATRLMSREKFDVVVIDTPARPSEDDIDELVQGCDLLLLPVTPDSLAMAAMALMVRRLAEQDANFYILLTMVPPPPQQDGQNALQAIKAQKLPVVEQGIRLFKVYKEAAAQGVLVNKVRGGGKAWLDWKNLAKQPAIAEFLDSAKS